MQQKRQAIHFPLQSYNICIKLAEYRELQAAKYTHTPMSLLFKQALLKSASLLQRHV